MHRARRLLSLMTAALLLAGTTACATTAYTDAPDGAPADDARPQVSAAAEAPLLPSPVPTTFEEVQTTAAIPFERTTIDDPQRDVGITEIVTPGAEGTLLTTHRLTLHDGVEVSRELVSEVITVAPITEVTARGTRQPAPVVAEPVPFAATAQCDPNYADACVPIASDVDCAGGSGNGPAYVEGPVRIIGTDIYDLDRDGDGIACEG